jgi:hypothetical protein
MIKPWSAQAASRPQRGSSGLDCGCDIKRHRALPVQAATQRKLALRANAPLPNNLPDAQLAVLYASLNHALLRHQGRDGNFSAMYCQNGAYKTTS